ncbi:hypothetical protein OKW45_004208 [Paraburkholderia sp. WSM4175]|uniref:hypothetical protein n=1 Tax=Paraburkholderia sp. WSM4175 TaxID=2991072 RepID=UPI003D1F39AC
MAIQFAMLIVASLAFIAAARSWVEAVNTVISIRVSFAANAFDIVTGDVERLGGRSPEPLRDVLAGALKSLGQKGMPGHISVRVATWTYS